MNGENMNSYERCVAILDGKIPDRIASMEIMIDPKVIKAIIGDEDYMDFCDYIDMDVVITSTPSKLYRNEYIDIEQGIFKNEWGTVRKYGSEVVSSIIDVPLKKEEDVFSYVAPDPLDEFRFTELRALVKRFKGKRLIGMHVHDVFNYPYYLRGMEELFMDMYTNPDIVHKLVEISVDHNIKLIKKAIDIGADYILLGDDYGAQDNLLISPKHFREFFLPGLKQIVTYTKSRGAYCIKHCCGNINSILDDLVSTGIDGLHPLDPSAGMNILSVKERFPNLTVIGGINCNEPLSKYSIEALENEVETVIERLAPGGRYIIASSNSIHSDVLPDNFIAMQNSSKTLGVY